jgi:glycosyltransferase involved in cell wall biosynthesis
MASGTPLISTPAGGIPSVVRNWHTGVIVPERSGAELAAAILTLARDPEMRVRLGEAARASVVARFGWEIVASRFEEAYDRALAMSKSDR